MTTYCVKCKGKTANQGEHMAVAKNGRAMKKSTCSRCGTRKSEFVSGASKSTVHKPRGKKAGAGFLDFLPF